jgi:hypothetical protein
MLYQTSRIMAAVGSRDFAHVAERGRRGALECAREPKQALVTGFLSTS